MLPNILRSENLWHHSVCSWKSHFTIAWLSWPFVGYRATSWRYHCRRFPTHQAYKGKKKNHHPKPFLFLIITDSRSQGNSCQSWNCQHSSLPGFSPLVTFSWQCISSFVPLSKQSPANFLLLSAFIITFSISNSLLFPLLTFQTFSYHPETTVYRRYWDADPKHDDVTLK